MLKESHKEMIEMYYSGMYTAKEITDKYGYADRKSLYDVLKKPEAKEYIEELSNESLKDALHTFKVSSKALSKNMLKIANGEIEDTKKVYAQLQALNSILEKAGLNSKTLVIEDKKSNDDDYNELMDMLDSKEEDQSDKQQGEKENTEE
ncbi:hypothetical protein [Alteribacillus sp. YIM 98480]|uniref:hypothetical protein n=1 Tax=Alteribacillus sp. YIM 98480 TaxID=2606599 RepID=UPI00131DDE69|nr:hypothetical protein [Alteribacillus sp. YIM 98480]